MYDVFYKYLTHRVASPLRLTYVTIICNLEYIKLLN